MYLCMCVCVCVLSELCTGSNGPYWRRILCPQMTPARERHIKLTIVLQATQTEKNKKKTACMHTVTAQSRMHEVGTNKRSLAEKERWMAVQRGRGTVELSQALVGKRNNSALPKAESGQDAESNMAQMENTRRGVAH